MLKRGLEFRQIDRYIDRQINKQIDIKMDKKMDTGQIYQIISLFPTEIIDRVRVAPLIVCAKDYTDRAVIKSVH